MGKSNKEEGIKVDEEDEVKGKLVILEKKHVSHKWVELTVK